MSASVRSLESVRRNAANLVRERIEARTRRVGARVSELAETLRSSVRDLRARDSSFGGGAAESIAERLGSLGHYLEVSDSNRLLADLESLARRAPLTFTATGFVLGFSSGRFLRASQKS